ncbi:MAG TPA: winged helix-turn-helix domain-containing protein [Blastocatellia bacterium]|nr:winged helix-turn-helix domain-containing protein [Blastocatellia bacterium]
MSQPTTYAASYRFDNFYLDARNRQLWRDDQLLPLTSRYFDVLLLLVSHSGRLVEKQRIFDLVWDGVFVTDSALTQCIKDVRRQLGDDASNPRYIKTVPKHGYIFIGQAVASPAPPLPVGLGRGGLGTELLDDEPEAAEKAAGVEEQAEPSESLHARPYKFLDYFSEQDAGLFFGRDAEVEAIRSQILARRSFVLHGRSGVGKSSILRAGLTPRLRSQGHHVFVIRSFTDPVDQMSAALRSLNTQGGFRDDGGEFDDLDVLIRRSAKDSPGRFIIFFFDQFEEFFSLLPEPEQRKFIEEIGPIYSDESLPVRLVFALREDLLAEMSRLKSAIPEIFHHEYRLNRLSREQAARAITGPAKAFGCFYEDDLIERLLTDLSDHEEVDPPQLQIVCDSIYDSRDSSGRLTLSTYEELGTASQILPGYLERVMNRFNAPDLQTAKEILTDLISAEGRRLVLRADDLTARAGNFTSGGVSRVRELVRELVAARIVRLRNQNGEGWIELAHDFLTAEVSRWLTAEEVELKRARGIIERAMENYLAHELVIDADALDLLLPFGERLRLTDDEANLVLLSILNRAHSVPLWLVESAPLAPTLIEDASRAADPGVRLCAIEAAFLVGDGHAKELLRNMCLWDEDLGVRKAACIALADLFQTRAGDLLFEAQGARAPGTFRRAVSLAMMRDYDKQFVRLASLPVTLSLLVIGGLAWVRLRRDWRDILRKGAGGTLGGLAAGALGGMTLGLGLSMARQSGALEASSLIFVLLSLGAFIGAIGGGGVSFGFCAASRIAYRHSRLWAVAGAVAGGAAIGGLANLLGVDTLETIFGQSSVGITGAFEGAVLGAGVSLGAVLTGKLISQERPWKVVAGAAVGALFASVVLTVIGGTLFSGSLEAVARSFTHSQVTMDPLGYLFGEVRFGRVTQIVFGAIEGLLFGCGVMGGIRLADRPFKADAE